MDIISDMLGIFIFVMIFGAGLLTVIVTPIAMVDMLKYIYRDKHGLYTMGDKVMHTIVALFFGTLTTLAGGALVVLVAEQVINHI